MTESHTEELREEEVFVFPLSFAQQRLWFLHQLDPLGAIYNMPAAPRLNGRLDLRALEETLSEIIRRHEVLRTTFDIIDGEPVQVISPPAPLTLHVTDLSAWPATRREDEAQRLATEEARKPFNLSTGPLMRASLLRLDEEDHVLLVTMHHIVSDGWSLSVLINEIAALYTAFAAGQPSPLPELPIQYADFAQWQRDWLQGRRLDEQLDYWRRQLAGAPPLLELQTDRPRPPVQTFQGAYIPFRLSERLSEELKRLCQQEGVTLFMLLMAAFQTLLYRYTGQADIIIGTPIAGRNRLELEALIGFFINTLVLRTDFCGNPGFRELLKRVQEVALGAYAHQDVPFEQLVEELQPERDLSHMPLVQVLFAWQNTPEASLDLPGLTLSGIESDNGTSRFDLALNAWETERDITGFLRYRSELFDAATIERFLGHFQNLLAAIVLNPNRRIDELQLLTPSEEKQLRDWNSTPLDEGTERLLHNLFEEQARLAPERVAVVFEDEQISYGELNARANRLAHYLIRLGVAPEVIVGICVERSIEMVVGLLGILKAGGAYLPLDPNYPPERLAFMLEDTGATLLLTQSELLKKLPALDARLICLDAERETIAQESVENPSSVAAPGNLAYVIYTSGSTGKPKGTLVTHRNVFHLFAATRPLFRFDEHDVWTLFHSYAFDFSVWELWGALLYGGRLVVVPYFVSRSPEDFYRLLTDEHVTVLNQTPSAFRQLMRVDESSAPVQELELRLVIFGGEALELQSLRPWFARHGDEHPALINMYGITETTVHVTSRRLTLSDLDLYSGSVIGRAISSLQVYILDQHHQLVPIGVPGEICVGGNGLARGYHHLPALTAERFIPHPLSSEAGARLYRSGDLGRYLPEGEIEYLGRIDQQVKIRGFRIELGEIEAALAEHRGVRDCVVITREDAPGDERLVCYLVADRLYALTISELREFLQRSLPDYMIPTSFIFLDELPLTANGKLDRKALPAPDASRPALEQNYVEPTRPLELLLAQMWREILGLERVGLQDNFFELGGNSIKGAIFINHLQERLGEIIHVVTIFTSPTIAQLAAYLEEHYSEALAGIVGSESRKISGNGTGHDGPVTLARVSDEEIEQVRMLVRPLPPREKGLKSPVKNPPAIFILSPPRSGSTLLRVMLGGHPALFAPPELELLSFNTLRERSETFTGAQSFWLEGALRAVMEARGCEADEAKRLVQEFEASGWSTQQFYLQLQTWLGGRRLVDKTPSYALDKSILRRAEEDFENPLYIHLLRHPYGMIHSFEEAKMDQLFLGGGHSFSTRELAEIVWNISHRNILEFLEEVPRERQHRLSFEELVTGPEEVLESLCQFLSLELHTDMLQPYREKEKRMTDGIYKESRMLGDVKFHQHGSINAGVAERWAKKYTEDFLGDVSKELASQLDYTFAENNVEQNAPTAHSTEQATVSTHNELRTIPRRAPDMESQIPLSFTQQGLFFLDQVLLHKSAYNIPFALRIHGTLDVEALLKSLHEIVRRHESLRTSFPVIDGVPAQQIAQKAFVPLLMIDLRELAKEEREARLRQIARDDADLPFELKRGPLLRATLLQLDGDEHVLIVNMHHIVSDGWSLGIFGYELTTIYDAFAAGRKSPLKELPVQYADFAIWQREWLSGSNLAAQLDYWKQQLAGVPTLQLPTDRPRPPVQTFRAGEYASFLSPALSQELQELSRREGVTLFMTLLAGFQLLLSRYAGQPDIVVGTPIAGRNRSEIEALIGFFVNTLVLRTDLSGNPCFRELLMRVQGVALGAYAHQDVPFDQLVQELQAPRDQSRTPLFQVMFALANAPRPETKISSGLTLSAVEIDGGAAKFDLTVVVRETHTGLSLAFEYNTDLFDAVTIERMMRHLEILLTGIVADPDKRIDELVILTEEEQHQARVAEQSRLIENDFPEACLQQLFEAQAERTPDAVALVFENEHVNYRELNERANQLAHHLQTLGVGTESLVAVCLERSIEMVLALLGILKAGGAYVPLDPAYPQERLAYMLDDCRAQVLITQQHLREKLPPTVAEMLCLDSSWRTIALESKETPQTKVAPENLAYMIYTSGSTGKPKGAMNTHEAICNRLLWMQEAYGLDESDAVLQKTPFSFDVSVWEFFWPLLTGARLVIARPGGHQDASYLVETIRRERVTTLHFVPSMLQVFLEERELESCLSLRRVICSGEALSFELQEKFFARFDAVELHNLYGPTEAAVDVTSWRCERGSARAIVPIGRAIANTEVHVLDQSLNLLPVGVAGEIYIGGVALARGYFGRAELTAEKFIPHPFPPSAGARLYRTGDLGRRLAGGEIEFLGRFDHQVKLRGYRIEPGEIEAALSRQADVAEALVIAREDVPGDKRLVAYLVAKKGSDVGAEELRGYLKSRLPEYMIPSAFVLLDEMPLTPNGKVDRQALPAPGVLRPEDSPSTFIAPRSDLEAQLVQIWEEVLNVKPVGVRDNFFALGGHSLLAFKLFSRIEQATGSTLSMTTLFDNATVEQQAVLLSAPHHVARVSSLVSIQPQGNRLPLFCVHPWGGNVLCYSELAKHLGLDQPVYGLQARGVEQKEHPHTSIEAMAADYLAEIRVLQPEGPYHLCGWSSGGLIAFEMARQLGEQGRNVGSLFLIDGYDLTELYTQAQIDESVASQRAARFVSEAQIVTGAGETVFALVHYDEQLGLTYEAPAGLGLVQSRNVLNDYVNYYLYVERAIKSYVPRPFNGRTVHFWTANRLSLATPETKRIWNSLSTGGIQINEVPGEHFTMLREPHVQTLARQLKKQLEELRIVDSGFRI